MGDLFFLCRLCRWLCESVGEIYVCLPSRRAYLIPHCPRKFVLFGERKRAASWLIGSPRNHISCAPALATRLFDDGQCSGNIKAKLFPLLRCRPLRNVFSTRSRSRQRPHEVQSLQLHPLGSRKHLLFGHFCVPGPCGLFYLT